MSGPVADTDAMIAGMAPRLAPGEVWVVGLSGDLPLLPGDAGVLGAVREAEGWTLWVTAAAGAAAGLAPDFRAAWITLEVYSALDGVGLTAAVATVLAGAGLPCNVIAGARHDHVLVPVDRGEEALDLLIRRAADHGAA